MRFILNWDRRYFDRKTERWTMKTIWNTGGTLEYLYQFLFFVIRTRLKLSPVFELMPLKHNLFFSVFFLIIIFQAKFYCKYKCMTYRVPCMEINHIDCYNFFYLWSIYLLIYSVANSFGLVSLLLYGTSIYLSAHSL